jgi:hypothetical protein
MPVQSQKVGSNWRQQPVEAGGQSLSQVCLERRDKHVLLCNPLTTCRGRGEIRREGGRCAAVRETNVIRTYNITV